jgi:hypothetical protein
VSTDGNVVYVPSAKGKNAKGVDIDFSAPAFIEDFGVVEAVREAYGGKLTLVPTMLQAAQAKGLTTVAIGKFGAEGRRMWIWTRKPDLIAKSQDLEPIASQGGYTLLRTRD